MADYKDTRERAIELAESGDCISVNHIRQLLRREDRSDVYAQLSGSDINRQLVDILRRIAQERRAGRVRSD